MLCISHRNQRKSHLEETKNTGVFLLHLTQFFFTVAVVCEDGMVDRVRRKVQDGRQVRQVPVGIAAIVRVLHGEDEAVCRRKANRISL